MKLNELTDIPIKDFKTDNAGKDYEKVKQQPQEADRTPSRFSLNTYNLKKAKMSASTEEALDAKVDEWMNKTQKRMGRAYTYSNDGKTAFVVYYDRDVTSLESKYVSALEKKITDFASAYEKSSDTKGATGSSNNIQKAIASLSAKSLKDLEKYVSILKSRDEYDNKNSK